MISLLFSVALLLVTGCSGLILAAAAQRSATPRVIWRFAETDAVVEDVAWDRAADRYLVTLVRLGGVHFVDRDSRITLAIPADTATWGTFAIGLDGARHTLWVSTFSFPGSARSTTANLGHAAVLEYEYPAGRLRRRWFPPDTTARALGDLAIDSAGSVYVSAGFGGAVYQIAPGAAEMRAVVAPHTFRSPQTPVVDRATGRLFVPDYGNGIALVEPAGGSWHWLRHDPAADLRGIDGLYAVAGGLIAIQNGASPNRILRLTVRGDSITEIRVLIAGGEATDVNHALLVGDELQFIAHSGWDRMSDAGVMRSGGAGDRPRLIGMVLSEH